MTYSPRPIDTSHVQLGDDIQPLIERLAEHNHDLWGAQRIKDGWRFGPTRNDAAREHPCLIPYADLPESEKEYDRIAAIGTLKAILALGYEIQRSP
jgi:ryanodine receptor 2